MRGLRPAFVLLHRWVGLTIAAFLFVAGLTGSVISWDHELDDWLNPDLHTALGTGRATSALDLAALVEARDPRVQATRIPLPAEPGEALDIIVEPRVDPATLRLYEPG